MNKQMIKWVLTSLLVVSVSLIGACSSEESSQPETKITVPAPAPAPTPAPVQKEQPVQPQQTKSTIEETPIVAPPAGPATEGALPEVTGQPKSVPPGEEAAPSNTESEMENAPQPAPETENAVTEETAPSEGTVGTGSAAGTSTPH